MNEKFEVLVYLRSLLKTNRKHYISISSIEIWDGWSFISGYFGWHGNIVLRDDNDVMVSFKGHDTKILNLSSPNFEEQFLFELEGKI